MLTPLRHRPAAPASDAQPTVAADRDEPCGCGWFDSSLDLRNGLQVCEHVDIQSLASELPLEDWLALHLQGWRPARDRGGH
jgi:hypothetical protein